MSRRRLFLLAVTAVIASTAQAQLPDRIVATELRFTFTSDNEDALRALQQNLVGQALRMTFAKDDAASSPAARYVLTATRRGDISLMSLMQAQVECANFSKLHPGIDCQLQTTPVKP